MPGFEALTDSVAVPVPPEERETLDGLTDRVRPEGELVPDSATVLAKPLRLDRVIVEVTVDPVFVLSDVGLAETLKSGAGVVGLKNSVIGVALPSPELRVAKFQFVSIVFGKE